MGKPRQRQVTDDVATNVALLETFWRHTPFHDMEITSTDRVAGRVIISVGHYILILIGVTRYEAKTNEMPDAWLYQAIDKTSDLRALTVETQSGGFSAVFSNLHLIRAGDYAVLIPPLDN